METTETFQSFIRHQTVPCLCKTETIFPSTKLSVFDAKNIAKILDGKVLRLRVSRRNHPEMKWENQCDTRHSCIEDILTWNGIVDCTNTSEEQKRIQRQLGACCNQHYWCYADYMYMKDLFCENLEILQLLDWDSLGFHGKDGGDSTMWFGSAGAHTLCHYDTYGYNIVVQVSGSKKWILFPPSDSKYMYPTRIPYEESSVFSEVNVACPDLQKHPKFDSAQACVITLQPGDILYVPHHWWHYVENLELSVSINLWYELESDAKGRLNESITRLVVGSCAHVSTTSNFPWINPTENIDSVKSINDNLQYLKQSINEVVGSNNFVENECSSQSLIIETEKSVIFPNRINSIKISPAFASNYMKILNKGNETKPYNKRKSVPVKRIKPLSFQNQNSEKSSSSKDMTFTDFVQCLTHKDVIDAVSKVIMKKYDKSYNDDSNISFNEMFSQASVMINNGLQGNVENSIKRCRMSPGLPTMCESSGRVPFVSEGLSVSDCFSESSASMQIQPYDDGKDSMRSIGQPSDYLEGTPIYKLVIGGSKRGGDKLFDIYGYAYTLKRRSSEGKTWVCTARSSGRPACPAAVYQTGPNEFRPNNKSHEHNGNPTGEIASRIMSDIDRTLEENPSMSPREIAILKLEEAKTKWPNIQLPKLESLITQIGRYRRKYFGLPTKTRKVPKHELKAYYGVTEQERGTSAIDPSKSSKSQSTRRSLLMLTDSSFNRSIDSPVHLHSDDSSGPSSSNGPSNRCLSPLAASHLADSSEHMSNNLSIFRHLVNKSELLKRTKRNHDKFDAQSADSKHLDDV